MLTRKEIRELVDEQMDEQFPHRNETPEEKMDREEYEAISYAEAGPQGSEWLSDGLSDEERQMGIVPFHIALEDARADEAWRAAAKKQAADDDRNLNGTR